MPVFKAPVEDIRFVMHDLLNVGSLAELPGYEEATPDMFDAIIEEGAKLCEEVLFPLNHSGDAEGCHFENGVVRTPEGFKEAYKMFAESGWTGLSADPEYGGQGLPQVLNFAIQEVVTAANMSFGMYPGLTHGAYNALHMHGSDELKQKYLPKLVDGSWSGTMCLTEPHCGTDLGLIRTKAVPADDGSYKITGQKIFISAGEHDLTENILHLVLAKLPDAPEGTRGISLFLVPKYLPKEEGGNLVAGPSNGVSCGSIEVKMGIKASATCVMNFDEATGWLVGEPHKGMRAMFTMMNEARLGVGIQGLGIGEVSFQNAVAYANDRIQGRALNGAAAPEKAADPIIVHPDVRRNLMTMKAFTEGARALSYWVAMENDKYLKHPDAKQRQQSDDLVALLTPIIKAYLTDMGYETTNLAVQVYGGAGYIKEHGVEQYIRDARITQIYEGTNGIQALDLVGRKMGQHMGRLLRRFFHPVQQFIEDNQANADLQEFVFGLAKPFTKLQQATALIAQKGLKDPNEAAAVATDYLRLFALVAMGYMWLRMAKVAHEKLAEGTDGRDAFYRTKIRTAQFFFQKMLPEADARFKYILAGKDTIMDIPAEAI